MSIKHRAVRALKQVLSPGIRSRIFNLGFQLSPEQFERFSYLYGGAPKMHFGLRRLAERGFQPASIADIGAFNGEWSRLARSIWPDAEIVMFEANVEKQDLLAQVAREITAELKMALLGPQDGIDVTFHVMESGSSVLEENSPRSRTAVTMSTRRLDNLLKGRKISFLKLDVQGFELEVLRGAETLLASADAVLLEVSLLQINRGAPLMNEVVAFMAERGFVVCDILELHRRPLDRATNQVDVFFVPRESELIADTRHWA